MTLAALPFSVAFRSLDTGWTPEMWEQLPDDGNRYELIDGVLYMSTAPSFFHGHIVRRINSLFERQLEEPGLAHIALAPVGVYLAPDDRLQPDIVVVRREDADTIHDKRIHGAPALVVEVLSPSNATYDLETKLATYARAGIGEYWIVRPAQRDVLVHSEPERETGRYLRVDHVAPSGELISPTLPVRAAIATFFAGSPDETL